MEICLFFGPKFGKKKILFYVRATRLHEVLLQQQLKVFLVLFDCCRFDMGTIFLGHYP